MRNLINSLCQFFGSDHVTKITEWVNEQYLFVASVDGLELTLHDLGEADLMKVVESCCTKLSLTVDMLTKGTWLVPKLTERQLEIDACIELRPELFKMVLGPKVTVVAESVAYAGDIIERFGSDQHVRLTPGAHESADIEAIFINLLVNTGNEEIPISVCMNGCELEEVKRIYIEDKYHSANPFTASYWQHILLSSVYRRLYNDAIFSSVGPVLSDDAVIMYQLISSFGHDEIQSDKKLGSEKIYSEYGAQIGYKVVRHNVVDLMSAKRAALDVQPIKANEPSKSDSLVVPFAKPKAAVSVLSDSDVASEWGNF